MSVASRGPVAAGAAVSDTNGRLGDVSPSSAALLRLWIMSMISFFVNISTSLRIVASGTVLGSSFSCSFVDSWFLVSWLNSSRGVVASLSSGCAISASLAAFFPFFVDSAAFFFLFSSKTAPSVSLFAFAATLSAICCAI